MAGKISAAMRGLSNFLRQEARMTKPETRLILQGLQSKQGFDDNAAQTLTTHLRDKFSAAMGGPNASHIDPDNLKPFLGVGNLGGEIWQRGQRAGAFNNEWVKHNFAQYSNLNSYNQYFHSGLSDAVRGQTVDYNDIGTKLKQRQNEKIAMFQEELDRFTDGRMLDEQALREERIAEGLEERIDPERLADLKDAQYDDPTVQTAFRISESTGDIRLLEALEREQRARERVQFAQEMGMNPKDLSLESMDRVKANIRENWESTPHSVNQAFLNQLDPNGVKQAQYAQRVARDNIQRRIDVNEAILKEYDNYLKLKNSPADTKDTMFGMFDKSARLTDEQIAAGLDGKQNGETTKESIKAARAFAQNATDVQAQRDYVEAVEKIGDTDPEAMAMHGAGYAAHVRLKQAQEDLKKIGSGKTLQETAAGSAQEAAVVDAAADFSGVLPTYEQAMAGNGKVSLDRAMLRERMKGDPSSWGFDAAAEHLAKEQDTYLGKRIEEIKKSKASDAEKRKMFDDAIATVQKNVAEGPGMSNYFFGNQLHTGAVGAAAIVGTMGVAFGGRKSNAELYSSPF